MEPWDADRELTSEAAVAVIEGQFPELAPVKLVRLPSGWDSDVYRVNEEWAFRFPRRQEVVATQAKETAVLPTIADYLSVSIPRIEKRGRPTEDFPYPFVGYHYLPGVAADRLPSDRPDRSALAADLGRALSELHAIPPERLAKGVVPAAKHGPAEWQKWVTQHAESIRPLLPPDLLAACEPWLVGTVSLPERYGGPARLVHNDVCPDHLLVDATSGKLTGLIDFGDLALGDPALDFVGLYCWMGAEFVTETLESYSLPRDDAFQDRLSAMSRLQALDWLRAASLQGVAEVVAKHVRWVRNAFDIA